MKNKLIFSILFLLISNIGTAQSCLPNGITFSNQTEIDDFLTNYPDCIEINGNVYIGSSSSSDIVNLNGLENITSISGSLDIVDNDNLINLSALENLTSIGGSLKILGNDSLTSLTGLESLTSIIQVRIQINNNLINLKGLENLTSISDVLLIDSNDNLTNLTGLESLTSIGSLLILDNDNLISLTGLENLTSINSTLAIGNNNNLINLTGIDDVTSIGIVAIDGNPDLEFCSVLSICNHISNGGPTEISENILGCNNTNEVEDNCIMTSVTNSSTNLGVKIFPNPTPGILSINFPIKISGELSLVDNIGRTILVQVLEQKNQIDLGNLATGVYLLKIKTINGNWTERVVKIL